MIYIYIYDFVKKQYNMKMSGAGEIKAHLEG